MKKSERDKLREYFDLEILDTHIQVRALLDSYERLVEALKFYANEVNKDPEEDWYAECPLGWRARQALAEVEDEKG